MADEQPPRNLRDMYHGNFDPADDTWVDWDVLRTILRPRSGVGRPTIGSRFTYESKRWQVAEYDRGKDQYRVIDLGPLKPQAKPSNAPRLGGKSQDITGDEPGLGGKPD